MKGLNKENDVMFIKDDELTFSSKNRAKYEKKDKGKLHNSQTRFF